MKYEAFFFDMDGTLLESGTGVVNAFRYAAEKMRLPFPPDLHPRLLVGPPLRWSFERYFGLTNTQVEEAVMLYREYYGTRGAYEAAPYPGIPELLRDLNATGKPVCLATSKYVVMAERMVDHFGFRPYLSHLAMSGGRENISAKKDMVAELLRDCATAPGRAVMIGDTAFDVEGGLANGVAFIGVLYGYGSREEMEREGANVFAQDVGALRELLFS